MELKDIPQLANVKIVDSENVGEQKLSIAAMGGGKSGKTHFWSTMPKPIVCLHMDRNTECADGFIRMYKAKGEPNAIQLIHPPSASGEGTKPGADWKFFSDTFIPLARNRVFNARTLVVEGYNYLGDDLVNSHRVSYTDKTSGQRIESVTIPGWGLILTIHQEKLGLLRAVTLPDKTGKPSYNLVVTCHLAEVGDEGNKKYMPAISGQFQSGFTKLFGASFILRTVAKYDIVNGVMQAVGVEHRMYTVPPNEKYECGDGIGGKDRKSLPPVIENTYQALCKAWGVEEEK